MAEFAIKRRRCLLCAQPLAERSAKAYPRSREFAALQSLGETCRTFRSRTMSDRSPEPAHDRDARHGSGRSPRTIAELQRQLDECRTKMAARDSEFGERIEHQSATIDVLKAMSASPGDPQP